MHQQIGAEIARFQEKTAEKQKICQPAQKEGEGQVEPHLPVFRRLGVEEQGRRGSQPEPEVQRRPQKAQGDAAAEDAEQVVDHPRRRAQQKPPQQGEGLGLYRDLHYRNSREKNPPSRRLSSS